MAVRLSSTPPSESSSLESGEEESDDRSSITNTGSFCPLDITIEILSRTPGSSLVRLRHVCKLWHSLTYDPFLIQLHLDRASKLCPPRIMIFSQDSEKYQLTLLDEECNEKIRLTRDSDTVLTAPPCNGLICLFVSHNNIKLCNPTTQEFLALPKPTVDRKRCTRFVDVIPYHFGFIPCSVGFHPSTKKYKVVRFFYDGWGYRTRAYSLGCEVFTLGSSDSWRSIGSINCFISGPGINVHGSIYWSTFDPIRVPDKIIALDLKDERFSEVILPPNISGHELKEKESVFLAQLEGNLCFVKAAYHLPGSMDIWMLTDYTNNVWIHRWHVTLPYVLALSDVGDLFMRIEPVFVSQGKMLVRCGARLYYCDLQDKQNGFKMAFSGLVLPTTSRVYAFVESLVPLASQR